MAEFLQFMFSGLTVGAIYALVALGFTLIYNASDVINFAQGEFVMLGGMVTVFATLARAFRCRLQHCSQSSSRSWSACCLHLFAIEPAKGASAVTLIIITIGASILLRGIASIVFDKHFHALPSFVPGRTIAHRRRDHSAAKLLGAGGGRDHRARAVAVHVAHADRQGDDSDRREPPGCATGRHQHRMRSSVFHSPFPPRSARSAACS